MNHDDADPDDAGLDSLRSMFRSLPDEEPPAGGLDALMAAARVKATQMAASAEPSLWERFVAMMRRPQVLALATIMILIGGAVFISQRRGSLESAGPQVQQETKDRAPTVQAPGGGETALELGGADTTTMPAASNEPVVGHASAGSAAPQTATPPLETAKSDMKVGRRSDPELPKRKTTGSVAKTPMKPKPSKGSYDEGALSSDGFGAGVAGGSVQPDDDQVKTEESGPTVKQLHAQARTAAANKDCTTVKSLAKQIARKDAPYYRANIATDTALAACLN